MYTPWSVLDRLRIMTTADKTSLPTIIPIKSIFENQEDKQEKIREIGVTAVWSLSSCKTGTLTL